MDVHVNVSVTLGDDEEVSEADAVARLRRTLQDLALIERRALVDIYQEALAAQAEAAKKGEKGEKVEKSDRPRPVHDHGKKFC